MGHRLMHHEGKCRFLHGHNYLVEVSLRGPLNDTGMVIDFNDMKGKMKVLFNIFDHAMCLFEGDPWLRDLKTLRTVVGYQIPTKVVVIDKHPTAEVLAGLWQNELSARYSWNSRVVVWETRDNAAHADPDYATPPAIILEAW